MSIRHLCAWGNDSVTEVTPRGVNCWLFTLTFMFILLFILTLTGCHPVLLTWLVHDFWLNPSTSQFIIPGLCTIVKSYSLIKSEPKWQAPINHVNGWRSMIKVKELWSKWHHPNRCQTLSLIVGTACISYSKILHNFYAKDMNQHLYSKEFSAMKTQ